MITPVRFVNAEEEIYKMSLNTHISRGVLKNVSIADIHFGAMSPEYQYRTLKEQFISKLYHIEFDVLSILGDYYDKKFMNNSDVIMYGNMLMNDIVDLCKVKNATLIIINGTFSHDADQLKSFYHYMNNVDIRIVDRIRFEYVKGAKILCIPEEYGKESEYYKYYTHSGLYDLVLMHGTLEGAIYTAQHQESGTHSSKAPVWNMEDFIYCKGCILSGHVHTPGCFNTHFYYCGSPYRWQFGEDHDKGFMITLHDLDTGMHYTHFEIIQSMTYRTININDMLHCDPKDLVEYIKEIKETQNIDYIRLEVSKRPTEAEIVVLEFIKKYYRNNTKVKLKIDKQKSEQYNEDRVMLQEKYSKYDYIVDRSLSEYDILTRYINEKEGYEYITVDELIEFLQEDNK